MRLALVTDAWAPQVNGVVRTLGRVTDEIRALGHQVEVVSPDAFRTLPCPTYPEIRLAVWPWGQVARRLDGFAPDAVHIATEGPLGLAAWLHCRRRRWPFTTSYHTKFPDYVHARFRVPVGATYALQRLFHNRASAVLTAAASVRAELEEMGFANLRPWTRGVDLDLFKPRDKAALVLPELPDYQALPRPIFAFVGRVAVEKSVAAFLALDMAGTKLVVGDGPQRASLQARFPAARFVGMQHGEALARYYAAADVFVMPSRTETFGLVQIEALASGLPVAAYPAPGSIDLLQDSGVGVIAADLRAAAQAALAIPAERCRAFAERFSWRRTAEMLLEALAPIKAAA